MREIPKMTFKEAFDEIEELCFVRDQNEPVIEQEWVNSHTAVNALMEELEANYAPNIEMTSVQRDTLLEDDPDSLIKSLCEPGTDNFDEAMWNPLTERQIAIAWLHPELIEVVD